MKDKKSAWEPMSDEDRSFWNKCMTASVVAWPIVIVIALFILVALIFFLDSSGSLQK
jgi:hypothetical protein